MRFRWRSLVLLLTHGVAYPCDFEVYSIEQNLEQSEVVVVGRIDSLDTETIEIDAENEWSLRAVHRAYVDVDQVLRGQLPAGPLVLQFVPELARTSCSDLLQPYQVGAHLLLMLGSPAASDTLWAPLIPPNVLPLTSLYEDTALYDYVQSVAETGRSAIRAVVTGESTVPWGDRPRFDAKVTNRLHQPLAVQVGSAPLPTGMADMPVLRFHLNKRGEHTFEPLDSERAASMIEPGETARLSFDLFDFYRLTHPGEYGIQGWLFLPDGDEGMGDNWGNYRWLWSFTTDRETLIGSASWGTVKARDARSWSGLPPPTR